MYYDKNSLDGLGDPCGIIDSILGNCPKVTPPDTSAPVVYNQNTGTLMFANQLNPTNSPLGPQYNSATKTVTYPDTTLDTSVSVINPVGLKTVSVAPQTPATSSGSLLPIDVNSLFYGAQPSAPASVFNSSATPSAAAQTTATTQTPGGSSIFAPFITAVSDVAAASTYPSLAKAQVQSAAQQAKLKQQQLAAQYGRQPQSSSSTWLWVGLGVAAVVGIALLAAKKD